MKRSTGHLSRYSTPATHSTHSTQRKATYATDAKLEQTPLLSLRFGRCVAFVRCVRCLLACVLFLRTSLASPVSIVDCVRKVRRGLALRALRALRAWLWMKIFTVFLILNVPWKFCKNLTIFQGDTEENVSVFWTQCTGVVFRWRPVSTSGHAASAPDLARCTSAVNVRANSECRQTEMSPRLVRTWMQQSVYSVAMRTRPRRCA